MVSSSKKDELKMNNKAKHSREEEEKEESVDDGDLFPLFQQSKRRKTEECDHSMGKEPMDVDQPKRNHPVD